MAAVSNEYKDRLFSFLFGAEENRAWTLSLYNTINDSHFTDADAITINTIKEVLYLGMHNDVSFLISDQMNLYEQQSSYNPNIPLRDLQYAGNLYEKYIQEKHWNKYGSRLLRLPVPKLVTFYNGTRDQPDETILRLSDSFPENAEADIEVRVRMININYGRNKKLLEKCRPLKEYAWFIREIRNNRTVPLDQAIGRAIDNMPADYEIRPFLTVHRAEVLGMLLTEYNEEEAMELFRQDGIAEGMEKGIEKGMEKGRVETLVSLVTDRLLSVKEAAARSNMSVEAFQKLITSRPSE